MGFSRNTMRGSRREAMDGEESPSGRGTWAGGGRYERSTETRVPLLPLFGLFALLGGGFLLSSLLRVHNAKRLGPLLDERRTALVSRFTAVTDAWGARERPRFENAVLRLQVEPEGAPTLLINLTGHDHADMPLAPQGGGLPRWDPLVFRGALARAPPLAGWRDPHPMRLTVQARAGKGWVALSSGRVDLTKLSHTTGRGSWKDCVNSHHGSWRPGNCTVRRALASACLVVDAAEAAVAAAAAAAAGAAARPSSRPLETCNLRARPALVYHAVTPPHGRSNDVPATTPLSLFVAVRSRHDPLLAAGAAPPPPPAPPPRPSPPHPHPFFASLRAPFSRDSGCPRYPALRAREPEVCHVSRGARRAPLAAALTNGTFHFGRTQQDEHTAAAAHYWVGLVLCVPPLLALLVFAIRWLYRGKGTVSIG